MQHLPIVIIGGGIAGFAAAIALARKGYRIDVVEQRDDDNETGAGLQLSPNASHILIDWGLGPALAKEAVAPAELAIRRWSEPRAYLRMPLNSPEQAMSAPFWVMMRADLHAALRREALSHTNVMYHRGWTLERIRPNGLDQEAYFTKGGESITLRALCIIGADGQRSMVRKLMGDARDLDPPAWEAWRTVIPAIGQPDFIRAATTNLWLGRHAHAVHYPVAAGQAINLVVMRRSGDGAEGWNRAGNPAQLADIAQSASPALRDLMAAAPQWSVWTLRDRAPSPFLAKGRIALVGDAAHPVLPFLAQGAAMAIEDAAVLADCLPDAAAMSRNSAEQGLRRYADMRANRITKVFSTARTNATVYHLPSPAAWFRDRRMAQLGPHGMRQRYSWLYDWRLPRKGLD